jgi:hypothetical protein
MTLPTFVVIGAMKAGAGAGQGNGPGLNETRAVLFVANN